MTRFPPPQTIPADLEAAEQEALAELLMVRVARTERPADFGLARRQGEIERRLSANAEQIPPRP